MVLHKTKPWAKWVSSRCALALHIAGPARLLLSTRGLSHLPVFPPCNPSRIRDEASPDSPITFGGTAWPAKHGPAGLALSRGASAPSP